MEASGTAPRRGLFFLGHALWRLRVVAEAGRLSGQADTYRRDIDGLRAVAVLPVILFHAGLAGLRRRLSRRRRLLRHLRLPDHRHPRSATSRAGRFSLARFYERRARRILPALAVVLLACVPVAPRLAVAATSSRDFAGASSPPRSRSRTSSSGSSSTISARPPSACRCCTPGASASRSSSTFSSRSLLAALWRWRPAAHPAGPRGSSWRVSLALAAWAARTPALGRLLPAAVPRLGAARWAASLALRGAPAAVRRRSPRAGLAADPRGDGRRPARPAAGRPARSSSPAPAPASSSRYAGPGSAAYRLLAQPGPGRHRPRSATAPISGTSRSSPSRASASATLDVAGRPRARRPRAAARLADLGLRRDPVPPAGAPASPRPAAAGARRPPSPRSSPSAPPASPPTASPAASPPAVRAIIASVTDTNPWRDTCKTDLDRGEPDASGRRLPARRHPPGGRLLGRQPRRRAAGRALPGAPRRRASASTRSPAAPARRCPA